MKRSSILSEVFKDKINILVTGGSGFIGGCLIRRLLKESDHKIFNLDVMNYSSDESSIKDGNSHVDRVKEIVKDEDASVLMVAASTEADITELDSYEERQMFLEDVGLDEPGVSKLIRSAYKLLNLSTYFTAGVKEVRAWTIKEGIKAPQAAGVIHTDFEKGFIRAEVIKYIDFVELGSELACKENGKMSVEGKEYVVADGDIIHFRFNT